MNKKFASISFQAAVYNQPVEISFITVKFLELAKHVPLLKIMIMFDTKNIHSFSQRKKQLNLEISCLFLFSNLARIPVYTRLIESRNYRTKMRIGLDQEAARTYLAKNKIASRRLTSFEVTL